MTANTLIDTEKFSSDLRRRGIDLEKRQILMTRFDQSQQSKDITLPINCGGFGRIHHFRRYHDNIWPSNSLPIEPALRFLELPQRNEIQVQVFQNAICSWRCWYCFVDFSLLSANPKHAEFKRVDDLLDVFLQESDRPCVIDLSGGQPDLVAEWGLWFADALVARGLDKKIYLWSDDNLSNDYLWRYLRSADLERLASYRNYGRVGCFKGFDSESFSFNTKADPQLFDGQFKLMHRLVQAGFDVYGYATFTATSDKDLAKHMAIFVDRLQSEVHPLFPLRTVPLQIFEFTPTRARMGPEHHRALSIQKSAVQAWGEELRRRFPKSVVNKLIFEHQLS